MQHQNIWREIQNHILTSGRARGMGQHRDKVQEAQRGLLRGKM